MPSGKLGPKQGKDYLCALARGSQLLNIHLVKMDIKRWVGTAITVWGEGGACLHMADLGLLPSIPVSPKPYDS